MMTILPVPDGPGGFFYSKNVLSMRAGYSHLHSEFPFAITVLITAVAEGMPLELPFPFNVNLTSAGWKACLFLITKQ